jgi:hypothetical protein
MGGGHGIQPPVADKGRQPLPLARFIGARKDQAAQIITAKICIIHHVIFAGPLVHHRAPKTRKDARLRNFGHGFPGPLGRISATRCSRKFLGLSR